jgi:hypothetical protein
MNMGSKQFKWPNGDIHTLDISTNERFIVVRHPPNHNEKAHFVTKVEAPGDLFKDFYHYYISYPSSGAQCRGCSKLLDPSTLCVKTQLICILKVKTTSANIVIQCKLCSHFVLFEPGLYSPRNEAILQEGIFRFVSILTLTAKYLQAISECCVGSQQRSAASQEFFAKSTMGNVP